MFTIFYNLAGSKHQNKPSEIGLQAKYFYKKEDIFLTCLNRLGSLWAKFGDCFLFFFRNYIPKYTDFYNFHKKKVEKYL